MIKNIIALLVLVAIPGTVIAEINQHADAPKPAASQFANEGTVLDVIESPMYTYLQVSTDTGAVWLAAYKNDIAKGDTVSYPSGLVMRNFLSRSLNRTFDTIIFVDSVVPVKK